MFCTRPSTKNRYKITLNSSLDVALSGNTNYNLLRGHVVDRPYNRRTVSSQKQSNLPSSTTGVCTEFKKISVDTYTENRVLKAGSRFINHVPLFTREENLKCSGAVSRTSSGKRVHFRINTTNRFLVFNYSNSTSRNNKFQVQQQQIQALKTQSSYYKKGILNGNSKEEMKCWIQHLKIWNGRYLRLFELSRKRWGAVCQGMSTRG